MHDIKIIGMVWVAILVVINLPALRRREDARSTLTEMLGALMMITVFVFVVGADLHREKLE